MERWWPHLSLLRCTLSALGRRSSSSEVGGGGEGGLTQNCVVRSRVQVLGYTLLVHPGIVVAVYWGWRDGGVESCEARRRCGAKAAAGD